jgi:hypothetical protein
VLGYLLWPGRHQTPVALTETAAAVTAYLDQAVLAPGERRDWTEVRDRAYEFAHRSRQLAQAALLDPSPARAYANRVLPSALALETLVDEVTAIANRTDAGSAPPSASELAELTKRIWTAARPVRPLDEASADTT